MKSLNLGCGRHAIPDWINLDSVALPGVDVVADLDRCSSVPLPFEDNSIDNMLLSHVLEHLEHTLPLMQELHRIARPDAALTIRVPHGASDDAWEDPTHRRAYFPQSFGYFSQPYYWRADYGYRGDWRTESVTLYVPMAERACRSDAQVWHHINHDRNVVTEMVAVLRAVKPVREPKRELQ